MNNPLILTLQLDEQSHGFYEALRQRHFPPERNFIPAHLTLFHQLPDSPSTNQTVKEAAQATACFRLESPTLRSLGRGVAVFFQSPQAIALHSALSAAFNPDLIPQDRQPLRPHIVLQNKVHPTTAKQTLAALPTQPLIAPDAIGLSLWRYLNGPWQHLTNFPFRSGEHE